MKYSKLVLLALVLAVPGTLHAQDDELREIKDPFVCVTQETHVCTLYEGCRVLHPVEMNTPDFWRFDLDEKEITARRHDGSYGTIKIASHRRLAKMLMLQGIIESSDNFPEGVAWSVGVHTETGRMSISVSVHAEVIAMLGSCHSL
jgi:hypothetical protein